MKVCSLCQRCYEDSVVNCTESSHPPLSETRQGSPEMIAGYRLESLLESGANFEVYRARQTACGRSCLVKIVSADKRTGKHFLREARLTATLFHPNVVDVYEAGSLESGDLFIVSEDADGVTLREFLKTQGVPPLLTSIQVMCQVAEALHAIHMQGLKHRAVNPENIILATDAEKQMLVRIQHPDFGGMIEHSIVSNKFLIDSALNTLKYFAPEQFSGSETNSQTDVYSLGIVLYEMLAGTPPFDASKAAVLIEKHRKQQPPEIRIDNFNLRMLLTHTLMESLQKQPNMRQSSAEAFARQIRHIEQLATHVSTPPPAGVVPPAPQRSAGFAAAVAPARSRRSITVQHEMIRERNISPIAANGEPAKNVTPTLEVRSVITTGHENEREVLQDVESEPLPVVNSVSPFQLEDTENADTVLENEPVVSTVIQKIRQTHPLRSRLKGLRKRLHEKLSEPATEIYEDMPVDTMEASGEELASITEPVCSEPKKVLWEQLDDDIPTIEDVLEVLSNEQIAEVPIALPEPEEITLVSARSQPIRIEYDQPAVRQDRLIAQKFLDNVKLLPTVLGNLKKTTTANIDLGDSAFHFSFDHHALMVGLGGVVILIGVFLIGSILIPDYVLTDSVSDSTAAKTIPVQTNTISPDQQPQMQNLERPLQEDENSDASQLKPLPTRERGSFPTERPQISAAKTGLKDQKIRASTSGTTRTKPKAEPDKNSVNKKPLSSPNKSEPITRPRIVRDPRT